MPLCMQNTCSNPSIVKSKLIRFCWIHLKDITETKNDKMFRFQQFKAMWHSKFTFSRKSRKKEAFGWFFKCFIYLIQSTKPNSIWSIFKLTVVFDNIILLVMNECILIFVKLFSHNTANVWRCLMIQKASWCFSVFETQQCVVIQFLFYTRKTYLLHLIFCTSICPPPPHTTPAMSFSLLQPDFKLN